jgi:hypothetical protein
MALRSIVLIDFRCASDVFAPGLILFETFVAKHSPESLSPRQIASMVAVEEHAPDIPESVLAPAVQLRQCWPGSRPM